MANSTAAAVTAPAKQSRPSFSVANSSLRFEKTSLKYPFFYRRNVLSRLFNLCFSENFKKIQKYKSDGLPDSFNFCSSMGKFSIMTVAVL
jgi:hypothetical protein